MWFMANCNVMVSNMRLVDNNVGIHLGIGASYFSPTVKFGTVKDSVIVGVSSASGDCHAPRPAKRDNWAWSSGRPRTGIVLFSFNSGVNGLVPLKKPWGLTQGGYPALWGLGTVEDTVFQNFGRFCGKDHVVIESNPATSDGQHPHHFNRIHLYNVSSHHKIKLLPPKAGWIVLDDCVSMDCDGPKHILFTDVDGSFTANGNGRGSVIARAEYFSHESNWAQTWHKRDPKTLPNQMLVGANGQVLTRTDVVSSYGIFREGCSLMVPWNAWKCQGAVGRTHTHRMLVIESRDGDTEVRSLIPIGVSTGTTTDLMNGGMDHGWCFGYTCLKRLSTFYAVVAMGREYHVYFGATNPGKIRLHLLHALEDEAVVIKIIYTNPQRLVAMVGLEAKQDIRGDMNYDGNRHKSRTRPGWIDRWPSVNDAHGTNAFERKKNTFHVTMRGNGAGKTPALLTIKTLPVVQVSLSMNVDINNFYEDNFVRNIAFVLGIPKERIRVVDIIAGSVNVDFEIGPPLCEDGMLSNSTNETCIDGGGACETKCRAGQGCVADSDCESRFCEAEVCTDPTCIDGVMSDSLGEVDVDCGGTICAARCNQSMLCKVASDCASGVCSLEDGNMRCKAPSCSDNILNGLETSEGCGGLDCPPCDENKACLVSSDCKGTCLDGLCVAGTCEDGFKNQDAEVDVDCGLAPCPKCASGQICFLGLHCESGVCNATTQRCEKATCSDGVKNQGESDVDCGNTCKACAPDKICRSVSDCSSGSKLVS